MNMVQAIAVGLVVAAAIETFKFFRPKTVRSWSRWRTSRADAAAARGAARRQERQRRERDTSIAAAAADGKIVPVARSGHRPVEVVFSDGTRSYFFRGDLDAYRRAVGSGDYDPRRSFLGDPPQTV